MDNSWTPTRRKIKYQSSASGSANRNTIIVQLDDPILLSKKLYHVALFISAGKYLNQVEVTEDARPLRSGIKFVFYGPRSVCEG